MNKKIIKLIPIYILILFFGIKVEAFTGTTTISESPSSTEKGSYITLKHTVDTTSDTVSIEYTYDNKYLQLVGFVPTTTSSCSLEKDLITCSNVTAQSTFVYPVFKIVTTFDGNKEISSTFNTTEAHSITKISVLKIDKLISVTEIQLDSTSENLIVGDSYQIISTVLPENATNKTVTYTSSDSSIATVDASGNVKAIKAGTTNITVASGNIKTIFTVTINDEEIPLEDIKIPEEIELKVGESQAIEMTFEPENTTVDTTNLNYSSSDSKVAIVDADGKIVALSEGTTTITVSIGDITTITKVTVTATEEKGEEPKDTKSNSNFGTIALTAIITFVITLILVFIISSLKRRKEVNNVDDDSDFKMNKYV